MDRAEKHPACNYCEPFVLVDDPFAVYRPIWFAFASTVCALTIVTHGVDLEINVSS